MTLAWTDDTDVNHITMIVVMAKTKIAAQTDVLTNWPTGKTIGTIAYEAGEFVALAERFRDDIHPDPPWMRVSPN